MLPRGNFWRHQYSFICDQACRSSLLSNSCAKFSSYDRFNNLPSDQIVKDLIDHNRASLARTITLMESLNPEHRQKAKKVLSLIMEELSVRKEPSFRIGLSGPPGAGKSTFIEKFGTCLLDGEYCKDDPYKVGNLAVLAIDPSSRTTGGSLLGDKTRMQQLSLNPKAFVRPTPAGGNLGGVARATNEAILICEASDYKTVLIETVGVGQSEFSVADMVDLFVLIIPPAGGDELQGLKRGIVEFADLVLVNKADGDLKPAARRVAAEYKSALKFMRHRYSNWRPEVLMVSSRTGDGIEDFWQSAMKFRRRMLSSGAFQRNRQNQLKNWMWNYLKEGVMQGFMNDSSVQTELAKVEKSVLSGSLAPGPAAEHLLNLFYRSFR